MAGPGVIRLANRKEGMYTVTIIAYLLTVAIPALSVYLIFALDLFGTGKRSTVLTSVAWGAVGAFGLAWVINNASIEAFGYETVTSLTAPIIEELLKALILAYFIQRPQFRYIVDGAVYGFAVGIGFAVSENLLVYLPNAEAVLLGSISRVLSTTLMHATASALVGISLGRLRRTRNFERIGLPVTGIGLAIALHVAYNNLVGHMEGLPLLLVAIGFGIGGSVLIAFLIGQGIEEEKKRFAETLGLNVGVSTAERKAVQNLGGSSIEHILRELALFFGNDKIDSIRRLLILQANIGILQSNLRCPASDRLRESWEREVAQMRQEVDQIRAELGIYVMSFLRGVFPADDVEIWSSLQEEIARFDPEHVHSFDLFVLASELAETFTPEQLGRMALRLKEIELFKNVSLADLENLSRAITERTFEDGEIIFNKGDAGDAMYLISEGQVNIYTGGINGNALPFRTYQAGDVVGEFSLLDGQPRSAGARANGRVKAMVLRRDHFMMFIRSRGEVVIAMLQYLADRVRYTTRAVETAIEWAKKIAQGEYDKAQALAASPVFAKATASASATPTSGAGISRSGHAGNENASEKPITLSGAFARLAAILEQREQADHPEVGDE